MTTPNTLQTEMDKADPNTFADALRQVALGTLLTPLTKTISNAAPAVTIPLNPPALKIVTCRVTVLGAGGSGALGSYIASDADGIAYPAGNHSAEIKGVALLADDGSSLTFNGTVTTAVVTYIPRSQTSMATLFPV